MTTIDQVIEKTMEFAAPPARVWRALTEKEELLSWFPDDSAFDLSEDGEGLFGWKDYGTGALRVVHWEPPLKLAWRWAKDQGVALDDGPSTLVEFTLSERDGGGTVLHLRESEFGDTEHLERNTGGWTHELGELEEYLSKQ